MTNSLCLLRRFSTPQLTPKLPKQIWPFRWPSRPVFSFVLQCPLEATMCPYVHEIISDLGQIILGHLVCQRGHQGSCFFLGLRAEGDWECIYASVFIAR